MYDGKYIKTKLKTFNGVINRVFSDNKILKEGNHYIFIAAICIDSILKVDKKIILRFIRNNANTRRESQWILLMLK